MNDARSANVKAELRPAFAGRGGGSLLEIDAWIPSEISAISPLASTFPEPVVEADQWVQAHPELYIKIPPSYSSRPGNFL